ncbi:MAG: UvrD-helicase domain-containing protein, partial [Bermanella sp.]
MNPQPLYVETVPLHGVRLIEASAGTGKTYTITSLYVRLVLGHECVPLSPEKILVVTFTRAATEELRDRIRKRLKQALAALQGDVEQDGLIALIVTQLADIDEAKQRLKDAMQVMDMAAIYTIHGFAQRLLRQNAMESSVSDDFELSLDEAELVQQAVRDVWRSQVYPAQGRKLSLILQNWQTPDDLQAQLASLLHKDVNFHLGPAAADYEQASADFERAHARLAQQWQTQGGAFIEQIRSNPKANGSFTRYLESRVQTLDQLLSQADNIKVKDAKVLAYFTTDGLKKSVKKGGSACAHELVQAFDDGWQHFQQLAESRVYASNQLLIALLQAT